MRTVLSVAAVCRRVRNTSELQLTMFASLITLLSLLKAALVTFIRHLPTPLSMSHALVVLGTVLRTMPAL